MTPRRIPSITLRHGVTHRCLDGHPWVYATELREPLDAPAGAVVEVRDKAGRFVARGIFNPKSQIAVRLFTRDEGEAVDAALIRRRVAEAAAYRARVLDDPRYGRVIYGESDGLSGLVCDRFGDVLVVQILSAAMESLREAVFAALDDEFKPAVIHERSDVSVRTREGLEPRVGTIKGTLPEVVELVENGLRFTATVATGQKTGWFYDQRDNRRLVKGLVEGRDVLDCFTYLGGFTVNAAACGARSVTAVDSSAEALAAAARHAAMNGLAERCAFVDANAFDLLRDYGDARRAFDTVILDPPAFAKNKQSIEGALRGYKDINLRGMRLVKPGGFLLTCSCSYHIDRNEFLDMLVGAARDARRQVRIVEVRGAGRDHPVLLAAPETDYLKAVLLQVV